MGRRDRDGLGCCEHVDTFFPEFSSILLPKLLGVERSGSREEKMYFGRQCCYLESWAFCGSMVCFLISVAGTVSDLRVTHASPVCIRTRTVTGQIVAEMSGRGLAGHLRHALLSPAWTCRTRCCWCFSGRIRQWSGQKSRRLFCSCEIPFSWGSALMRFRGFRKTL